MTTIERGPRGREEVPVQVSRLLEGHETILKNVRIAAQRASALEDDGTNHLLVSSVLRTHEPPGWFLYAHVVQMDLVGESNRTVLA